jgi:8-oxo-dGTP pyrophosphatase MutT (NUDIX family)
MGIFSHNIYENIRTRTIVLYQGNMLLHPPQRDGGSGAWTLPGGGLELHESIAECARREVFEETGITVRVGKIAFLLEWIVPKYSQALEPEEGEGYGYGLEVFHYAYPEEPLAQIQAEQAGDEPAQWIPLVEVPELPIWPRQLKELCRHLANGKTPEGCFSFTGQIESPWTKATDDPFAVNEPESFAS